MQTQTNDVETVRRELEGKRKPLIREGVPMIYPVDGAVFVFDDFSGIAYLNGERARVEQARRDGLKGMVASIPGCYIIPVISVDAEGQMRTSDVRNCSRDTMFSIFNSGYKGHAPVVYRGDSI